MDASEDGMLDLVESVVSKDPRSKDEMGANTREAAPSNTTQETAVAETQRESKSESGPL